MSSLAPWPEVEALARQRGLTPEELAELRRRYMEEMYGEEAAAGTPIGQVDQIVQKQIGSPEWTNLALKKLIGSEGWDQRPVDQRHQLFNNLVQQSTAFEGLPPKYRQELRKKVVMAPGLSEEGTAWTGAPAPPKTPEETTPWQELINLLQVQSGVLVAAAPDLIAQVAQKLGSSPEEVAGDPTIASRLYELARLAREGARTRAPGQRVHGLEDVKSTRDLVDLIAAGIGGQIPVVLGAGLAGLGGFVAGGPVGAGVAAGALEGAVEAGEISSQIQEESGAPSPGISLTGGAIAGLIGSVPIFNFFRKVPGVGRPLTNFIMKRVLPQVAIEASEEALQTIVERATVDWAHAHRGDLEKIKLTTHEGRVETAWEVANASFLGGLIGGGMGMGRQAETAPGAETAPVQPETAPEAIEGQPSALPIAEAPEAVTGPQEPSIAFVGGIEDARAERIPKWVPQHLVGQWVEGEVSNDEVAFAADDPKVGLAELEAAEEEARLLVEKGRVATPEIAEKAGVEEGAAAVPVPPVEPREETAVTEVRAEPLTEEIPAKPERTPLADISQAEEPAPDLPPEQFTPAQWRKFPQRRPEGVIRKRWQGYGGKVARRLDQAVDVAHALTIDEALEVGRPVSAAALEEYKIKPPDGWSRDGDMMIPPSRETLPGVRVETQSGKVPRETQPAVVPEEEEWRTIEEKETPPTRRERLAALADKPGREKLEGYLEILNKQIADVDRFEVEIRKEMAESRDQRFIRSQTENLESQMKDREGWIEVREEVERRLAGILQEGSPAMVPRETEPGFIPREEYYDSDTTASPTPEDLRSRAADRPLTEQQREEMRRDQEEADAAERRERIAAQKAESPRYKIRQRVREMGGINPTREVFNTLQGQKTNSFKDVLKRTSRAFKRKGSKFSYDQVLKSVIEAGLMPANATEDMLGDILAEGSPAYEMGETKGAALPQALEAKETGPLRATMDALRSGVQEHIAARTDIDEATRARYQNIRIGRVDPDSNIERAAVKWAAQRGNELVFFEASEDLPISGIRLKPGLIAVRKGQKPAAMVASMAHESIHALEEQSPGLWNEFTQFVRESTPSVWADAQKMAEEKLRKIGREPSQKDILRETATYALTMSPDQVWEALAADLGQTQKTPVRQRLADRIYQILRTIDKALGTNLLSGNRERDMRIVAQQFRETMEKIKGPERAEIAPPGAQLFAGARAQYEIRDEGGQIIHATSENLTTEQKRVLSDAKMKADATVSEWALEAPGRKPNTEEWAGVWQRAHNLALTRAGWSVKDIARAPQAKKAPPTPRPQPSPYAMYEIKGEAPAQVADVETARQTFMRKVVDKYYPWLTAQTKIAGEKVAAALDVHTALGSLVGKAGARITFFEKKYVEPLMNAIGELRPDKVEYTRENEKGETESLTGIEAWDMAVHDFLYARHAKERNARIFKDIYTRRVEKLESQIKKGRPDSKRTKKLQKDLETLKAKEESYKSLSGMSDAEAQKILDTMKEKGWVEWETKDGEITYKGKLGTIGKRFSDMEQFKIQTLVQYGLLSEEVANRWRGYKYYAPLKGRTPTIKDRIKGLEDILTPELQEQLSPVVVELLGGKKGAVSTEGGQGISATYKARRALGRVERAQNMIIPQLVSDVQSAIKSGEENRVKVTLLKFAEKHLNAINDQGDPLFEIDKKVWRKVANEDGTIDWRHSSDWAASIMSQGRNNVIPIRVKGEDVYLTINHVRLASALQNLNAPKLKKGMRTLAAFTRILSGLATKWNPQFLFSNAIRDIQTAKINLTNEQYKKVKAKLFRDYLKSLQAVYKSLESDGTLTGEWNEAATLWREHGGKVEFWALPDLDRQMKKLQKMAADSAGDRHLIARWTSALLNTFENAQTSVENATRLIVFKAAVDAGVDPRKAAKLSRNITVDFNQSGEWGSTISAVYMFANASIQGSAIALRTMLGSKKGQAIAVGLGMMGYGAAQLARAMGGEDDDGIPYYEKVPEFVRERNFVIMRPGTEGKYYKIPLPYGFNVPWVIGNQFYSMFQEDKDPVTASLDIFSAFVTAFNPLGDVDFKDDEQVKALAQTVMPSAAKPIMDIALNRNWYGGPIAPENRGWTKYEQAGGKPPDYTRYFNSARGASKAITEMLAKLGGVEAATQSENALGRYLDMSPENMDYLFDYYTSGAGKFIVDTGAAIWNATKGGDRLPIRRIPMLRALMGEKNEWFDSTLFYANLETIYGAEEDVKWLKENAPTQVEEYAERKKAALLLLRRAAVYRKKLKKAKTAAERDRLMREFNRLAREAGV